ncbi:hypothetical protein B1K54_08400 [Streptomyces sp. fd1-xmd]|nr:hypothetical protein B1K54_08400 [Streptomyces sp. fd1-xmd]
MARSTRVQPVAATAACQSAGRAVGQSASGASAMRVQVRSAPPGPAEGPARTGGRRLSTGAARQSEPALR